jgi:dTDP-4-amino-4,6-dideoxygalactose transaminase
MKSGEGGFLFARRAADASYADLFADKCYRRTPEQPATPAFPAVNLRLSAVHAAIGLCQLKRLPGIVRRQRAAGLALERALAGLPLNAQPRVRNSRCSYWWFSFSVDTARAPLSPSALAERLQAEGIPCSVGGYRCLQDWDLFRTLDRNPNAFPSYRPGRLARGAFSEHLPNARWAMENLLRLPVNPYVGAAEARDFRNALVKILGRV